MKFYRFFFQFISILIIMLKVGFRVEGRTKFTQGKQGTIVRVEGDGRKRKLEIQWDDQSKELHFVRRYIKSSYLLPQINKLLLLGVKFDPPTWALLKVWTMLNLMMILSLT